MRWERAGQWSLQVFCTLGLCGAFVRDVLPDSHGWMLIVAWFLAVLLGMIFVGSVVLAYLDMVDSASPPEDGDEHGTTVRQSRTERLRVMSRYFPRSLPAGWTKRTNERRSVAWRFYVGDVLVVAWARKGRYGAFIQVAMSRPGSAQPVDVAQADAILVHFQDVTEFAEADTPSAALEKRYPGVRLWYAYAIDTAAAVAKQPLPATRTAGPDTPLRELVRVLLPKKLPRGWSPPVAVPDIEDGWTMLVDDRVLVAQPCSNGDGLQLVVTIVGEPEEKLTVGDALDVLRHIRGVGDFRQADGEVEDGRGVRSFVADIHGTEGVRFEPKELN